MTKILAPSDHLRQQHAIPSGKHIAGHKIVVEGVYFAFDKKTGDKIKRPYREEFELAAHEHLVHGQGALGHILSDKLLVERLAKKDVEFRAIQTHHVTRHENILVDAPKPPKSPTPALKVGDKVLLPTGIAGDTGVIVKLLSKAELEKIGLPAEAGADVKLDVNGNVSPFDLALLKLA